MGSNTHRKTHKPHIRVSETLDAKVCNSFRVFDPNDKSSCEYMVCSGVGSRKGGNSVSFILVDGFGCDKSMHLAVLFTDGVQVGT